jgi:ABC-type Fe3+-hydroxamate transport system substrate-binding protein
MEYTDQLNRMILLNSKPKRIISLVPSQTELLYDLGLDQEIIGITKFCVHPESWFRNKTRIGGTKALQIEKIKSLNPDLVIANKEENLKEQIEEIEKFAPVWISDIASLDDALSMISSVGTMVEKTANANNIILEIKSAFARLKETVENTQSSKTVLYLIWREPYYCAGSDTFISDMITKCGLKNCIEETRYPEATPEKILQLSPDYILLSSEPYPFKEKHIAELKKISPGTEVILVDGEMFSWYGSRLRLAPAYFSKVLSRLN